jgi:YidC/Oxa1 family membrane protein insertase
VPLLASTIGQIFEPVFHALSWLLAFYYSLIPNYVVAIAMLTVSVMIVSFPLNRAATRSMYKMQLLQPEVQKLRARYKAGRDQTVQERQEMRQKLNEEMMALYRENNVSMAGGCLPNLVVFPIFIVLYDVIRGLTNTCSAVLYKGVLTCTGSVPAAVVKAAGKHTSVLWAPRYIIENTALYRNLHATNGKMLALGINLDDTVRTAQHSWVDVLPFVAFVLVAIVLQYVQLRQMMGRNQQTGAGQGQQMQQMQAMQKFMPLIMAVIYISIPAAVNTYFVFSSLFRIGQQEWMFRRDPHIVHTVKQLKARRAGGGSGGKKNPGGAPEPLAPTPPPPTSGLRGIRERLASALAPEGLPPAGGSSTGRSSGGGAGGAKGSAAGTGRSSAPGNGRARPQGAASGQRSSGKQSPAAGAGSGSPSGAAKSGGSKAAGPKPGSGKQGASGSGQARSGSKDGGATPASAPGSKSGSGANGTSPNGSGSTDGDDTESRPPRRPRRAN